MATYTITARVVAAIDCERDERPISRHHIFISEHLKSESALCGVNPVATFKQKLEAKHLTVKMIFQD